MDCINFSFEGENLCDISWAAKNYACSFCKREFRSAQALGGHMNVHRRDRARLRLLPSNLPLEICPNNPNSYFTSSSSSSVSSGKSGLSHNYPSCDSLFSPSQLRNSVKSSSSSSTDENKKSKFDYSPQNHVPLIPKKGKRGVVHHEAGEKLKGFAQKDLDDEYFNKFLKKEKDHKEEVDLELRLGHL